MKNSKWMALSGAMGILFFIIANFTNVFQGSAVIAGMIQVTINTIVFFTWGKGFLLNHGLKKVVAGIGTLVPLFMASWTLTRIIIPWIIAHNH